MNRMSKFAVAVVGGLALTLGVAGCGNDRLPQGVSSTAMQVAESNGMISYSAPSDGMVTVYDTNVNRVDYSGEIHKGQDIVVDTTTSEIRLNGRVVDHNGLNDAHAHRIYFEPSARTESSRTTETNTSTVETSHGDH